MTAEAIASKQALRPTRDRAVIAGGIWMVTYALLQVIRVGSQIILAALLSPQAFGVVRLSLTVVQGLRMCSEVGIRESIIQNDRGDDEHFLNTAFTLQIGRGVLIWLLAAALAWPVALFYEERSLIIILPVLATVSLIAGFNSTAFIQLNRTLREGPRAALELAQAVITRGTMILWAIFVTQDAWALVAGSIAGALAFMLISHKLPGHRNRPQWDPKAASSILRFGTWIFIGTIIAFLGQQLDALMLGKLDALSLLGVYSIALTIARLPTEVAGVVNGHVLYPVLASIAREEPRTYAQRLLNIRAHVLPMGAASVIGVVAVGPWFFRYLFDDRYSQAEWIAPLACASVWVLILNSTVNRALLSLGQTKTLAFVGLARVIGTAIAASLGFYLAQVPGFIIGVLIGTLFEHVLGVLALRKQGVSTIKQDIIESLYVIALGIGAGAGNLVALSPNASQSDLIRGVLVTAGMVGIAGVRSLLQSKGLVQESVQNIRGRSAKSSSSDADSQP